MEALEAVTLSQALGYFCILACGLSKVPQILVVRETRAVAGISVTSILLELYCHGVLSGFYTAESYPWSQYLEYPLLVLQNFLLLLLLGLASNAPAAAAAAVTLCSAAIAAMAGGAVPREAMLLAMSITIPLGLSSKAAQVAAIRAEGSSANVSYVSWVVNGVTGVARLYTHLHSAVPAEPIVLLNSCTMILANTAVCLTIALYRGAKPKTA